MKKLLLIFTTILLTHTILTAQQPIKKLENWVAQQTEGFDAGEVVEFLNGGRAPGDISFGSENIFNSAYTSKISASILNDTKFIVAYRDGGNSSYGTVVIGTISGNIISYGTNYIFNTAHSNWISAATLDSTHFVITYSDGNNSDHGTAIIGVISGNSVTFGSEYIFNSAPTSFCSATSLDASQFVVVFKDKGNNNKGTSVKGSISGSNITFSSKFIFNPGNTHDCSVTTMSSTSFVVTYCDDANSEKGTARVGTVSGSNISFGYEYVFNSARTWFCSATSLDGSHFIVAYRDLGNSNYGTAIIGTVSGNSISYSSEFIYNNEYTGAPSASTLSSDQFVVAYDDGYSSYGTTVIGTITGNTISFGSEYVFNSGRTFYSSVIIMNEFQFAIAYQDEANSSYGTSIVGDIETVSIITSADSIISCPGIITVPITVQNLNDVTDFSIILDYGTTNLTYTGFQNANTQLSTGTLTITENNGEITIAWNSTTAANITADTLLELQFTGSPSYNQNIENLTWDEPNSYYKDSNGDNLLTVFNDGQVTIEPIPENTGSITGLDNVCQGTTNESYQIGVIANVTSYVWELNPINSGTINGSGTDISIDYSATFSGQTTLSVYGTNSCGNGSPSSLVITVASEPAPTANANADATVCENSTYTLSGSATNQQSILWSTTGDGTFDDTTSLTADYTPGSNDIASSSATLTLTAYAIAPCAIDAVDAMVLTIQTLPTANAGSNDTIGDNATYTLSGSALTNQQSILWTTAGNGTFDDATLLAATYTPGNNDIAADSVILTLTANAIAPCATNADDNMTLYIQPSQQINLLDVWNIASFYVAPNNIDLLNILQPLVTSYELTKVIDEQGNFIQEIPGSGWMNTIGNMANTEGYYIKVNQNTQLDFFGTLVVTPFDIPLSTGWNIMGYPTQDTTNAITVVQPLIDSSYLTKVIDEAGGFIQEIPGSGWMNTIGDFMPGEGYYIKATQNCTLTIGREPPTITTDYATGITHSTATSGGNVTYSGGAPVTARGVCWSTSPNPTLADSYTTDGSGSGAFVSNIAGLAGNTQYYVRAYATNSEGTDYGNEVSFTTDPVAPTVITDNASYITSTTAVSGGNATSNGGAAVTARGVCWSTSSNPTLSDSYTTDGTGTGTFTSNLTGLTEDSTYYVRTYATNSAGVAYGNEVSFMATQPPPPFANCGDLLTYEGQSYTTVQIGSQCWMAENLNVGTMIQGSQSQANNSQIEKYCYNNDPANCDVYGGLYQWNEMMQYTTTQDAQGLCPNGWHLPTDGDWTIISDFLGGATIAGSKMKEVGTTHWWSTNTSVTNSSGFTALPGGYRNSVASFYSLGGVGRWWSSSQASSSCGWCRFIDHGNNNVFRAGPLKISGFSVRCLKD